MSKILDRYIRENIIGCPDEEIRTLCSEKISVWYGFNNYRCDLNHIHELREAVKRDYPDMDDEEIYVYYVQPQESIRHARFTMLCVSIPTEDFIGLRAQGKISIL